MKTVLVAAFTVLCVLSTAGASAEVLHGVRPLSTFGEIKADFPNGRFERVKAAWVKDDEAFYSMAGTGFPGKLYLFFDDSRPSWRAMVESMPVGGADEVAADDSDKEFGRKWLEAQAAQPDETALTIRLVRWAPIAPIPMERVKAKYGEPTKCDFDSEDFSPFCLWESRSLTAKTTNDKKSVFLFTAGFTKNELRVAYKAKGSYMPEWLKEEALAVPKQQTKPNISPARKARPTI